MYVSCQPSFTQFVVTSPHPYSGTIHNNNRHFPSLVIVRFALRTCLFPLLPGKTRHLSFFGVKRTGALTASLLVAPKKVRTYAQTNPNGSALLSALILYRLPSEFYSVPAAPEGFYSRVSDVRAKFYCCTRFRLTFRDVFMSTDPQ